MTAEVPGERADWTEYWVQRFLDDLVVVRSPNTVRAYSFDLRRWARFCQQLEIDPFCARPRTAIQFIRVERKRPHRGDMTISPRTLVRRLTAIRQWYEYLALEPEETGVHRNPIPSGSASAPVRASSPKDRPSSVMTECCRRCFRLPRWMISRST